MSKENSPRAIANIFKVTDSAPVNIFITAADFASINSIFDLDQRPYGWYSLFVAINSFPAAYISYAIEGDWRMSIIWLLWGILWLTGFIETVLKKDLGKFVGYLAIFEGIVTAWVPGFLLLRNLW